MKTLFFLIALISSQAFAVCDGTPEKISFRDPVNSSQFDIEARVYRPLGKFPVVFILPPIVGETPLDGALGLNLCINGIGAYILNVLNDPPDAEQVKNLNVHEDALIRAEFSVTKWIEKLKNDPLVNGQFGIMGASQGGILSAYLAGVVPELKASVLIASSGNVAEVLATSTQETVSSLRKKRKEFFNLSTDDEYEQFIRPWITLDPLFVASSIPPGTTLLFIMTRDTDVPTKNQREYRATLTGEKVIEINNTHVPGIVEATTLHSSEIINFFKGKL